MNLRRERIYEAQEIAKKKKKEEEAKRRANMAKEASRYNSQMSAYRVQNNQKALRGVEKLNHIQATNFANIPQGSPAPQLNTLKGKDMAEMLKGKEQRGSVTIVWVETNEERQNRNNVIINNDSNLLDLYDDGGYNKNELNSWRDALMSKFATIQLCELREEEQWERTVLINHQWLNLDSLNITTLPNMGCVALIGDSILLLDNDSLPFLKWNIKNDASQIVTCGDRIFGKQNNQIVEIKGTEIEVFCQLNDDNYSIYSETDSSFIVCAAVVDLFVITRMNILNKTYDELLRTPTPIRKVISNGRCSFTLLKQRVIDISQIPKLFYSSDIGINDICMCREGILLATDKQVLLMKSPNETTLLSAGGAKRLWCDGPDIYLIDNTGNLIRYSKIKKS